MNLKLGLSLRQSSLTRWRGAWPWLALLGACAVMSLAQAQTPTPGEDKVITWAVTRWPPIMTFKNASPQSLDDMGDGITDQVILKLAANLPGYQHRFMTSNIPRIWKEIADGHALCSAATLWTPERARLTYMTPMLIIPPLHLVVRRDRLKAVTRGAAAVSIRALAQRKDIVGYLEVERSYGPAINAMPDDPGLSLHRMVVPTGTQLITMLDIGRMDYTVEFPMVIEYMRRQGQLRNDMVVVPLQEAPNDNPNYVACTRNAWGESVTRDIERAVQLAEKDHDFRHVMTRWLPAEIRPAYAARVDAWFKHRPPGGRAPGR